MYIDLSLGIVLTVNRCRDVQPTMGQTICKQVVLNCIRKVDEYKLIFKPDSNPHYPMSLLYLFSCKVCYFTRSNAVWNSKQSWFQVYELIPSVMDFVIWHHKPK